MGVHSLYEEYVIQFILASIQGLTTGRGGVPGLKFCGGMGIDKGDWGIDGFNAGVPDGVDIDGEGWALIGGGGSIDGKRPPDLMYALIAARKAFRLGPSGNKV